MSRQLVDHGQKPRPPLPLLTVVRFFAAAEVVLFHHSTQLDPSSAFLRGLISGGYQAVTFFFVLSGFILTYVYGGGNEQSSHVPRADFWRARFARIVPAYFLALLISLPFFAYSALVSKVMAPERFVLGILLVPSFLQAWWPPAALLWNIAAWSLSAECLFYLLFPLLLQRTSPISRNNFIIGSYALVSAAAALRIFLQPPAAAGDSEILGNFVGFFPVFHLPQFIFGVALGRLFLFGRSFAPGVHAAMLFSGAIGAVLIFGFGASLPWWLKTDPVLVIVFGLIIFGGAHADGVARHFGSAKMLLLGEASYSLYILHTPIALWWNWAVHKMLNLNLPAAVDVALYFAFACGLSVLTFLYFEKPLRRRILGGREHRAV